MLIKPVTDGNLQASSIIESIKQVLHHFVMKFELDRNCVDEDDISKGILESADFSIRSKFHTKIKDQLENQYLGEIWLYQLIM